MSAAGGSGQINPAAACCAAVCAPVLCAGACAGGLASIAWTIVRLAAIVFIIIGPLGLHNHIAMGYEWSVALTVLGALGMAANCKAACS